MNNVNKYILMTEKGLTYWDSPDEALWHLRKQSDHTNVSWFKIVEGNNPLTYETLIKRNPNTRELEGYAEYIEKYNSH